MALYNQTQLSSELDKAVQFFTEKLKQLRVGRPRVETFAELSVEVYGVPSPLQSVAHVSVESATSVLIKPYYMDKALLEEIVKVVNQLNLGFNPQIDSDKVRVNIPPMTEERRKETVKELGNMLEESKTTIRQIRQKYITDVKELEGVSEDEQDRDQKEIQKHIDAANAKLKDAADKKEAELTTL